VAEAFELACHEIGDSPNVSRPHTRVKIEQASKRTMCVGRRLPTIGEG